MIFGHRKCSGGTGYLSGHQKGFRAPPAKDMGLMGQEGKHTSHKGAGAPPIWASQIGEGKGKEKRKKGIGFPLPPLSFLLRIGIGKGRGRIGRRPSRIPPTWGAPLAASPPLQPIYMRGAPLEHTPTILSRVQRPPSTVYASDHILVVLRRSPARITSSPSPRRRADGTHLLPRCS